MCAGATRPGLPSTFPKRLCGVRRGSGVSEPGLAACLAPPWAIPNFPGPPALGLSHAGEPLSAAQDARPTGGPLGKGFQETQKLLELEHSFEVFSKKTAKGEDLAVWERKLAWEAFCDPTRSVSLCPAQPPTPISRDHRTWVCEAVLSYQPAPHYPTGSDSQFESLLHLQWQLSFFFFWLHHESCRISVP